MCTWQCTSEYMYVCCDLVWNKHHCNFLVTDILLQCLLPESRAQNETALSEGNFSIIIIVHRSAYASVITSSVRYISMLKTDEWLKVCRVLFNFEALEKISLILFFKIDCSFDPTMSSTAQTLSWSSVASVLLMTLDLSAMTSFSSASLQKLFSCMCVHVSNWSSVICARRIKST